MAAKSPIRHVRLLELLYTEAMAVSHAADLANFASRIIGALDLNIALPLNAIPYPDALGAVLTVTPVDL